MPVVDDAAGEFIGVAAVAARIFPPFPAKADSSSGKVTIAVVIVKGVSIPASGIYHRFAPGIAKSNNPTSL